jgi:hypothetical protein
MWQGHLIRQAPGNASPRHPPPPRRVYLPTPDGFERFLREGVGLSRDESTLPCACSLRTQTRAAASI